MKRADLPIDKASVPDEEAHQPSPVSKMPPDGQNQSKKLTFAKNVDYHEKPSSQISSSYKDVLSQPPTEVSHSQRLMWLQKRRTAGLWAQCDDCDRWRYLPAVLDRHELPKKWYCWMNTDKEFASCSVPEAPLRVHDEEDLIHSEYSAGSLVWARLTGWPWWPAMVDDCPDTEQYYWLDGFSDIPTHYNVVFFDTTEATRAWIAPEQLKPYSSNKESLKYLLKSKKYIGRLKAAMSQAVEAEKLPVEQRLEKYSFIARHKGHILSPKKMKKNDLVKYQKQFKKKFNVDFPIESSGSDEENSMNTENTHKKKNSNVIILGTPKRVKRDNRRITKKVDEKQCDEIAPEEKKSVPSNSELQQNDESVANIEKACNSMVVQVGSTEPDSIDNDTSATYVPENASQAIELTNKMDTPNSDDFDF